MKRIITIILLVLTLGFLTFNYVKSESETKEVETQLKQLTSEYQQTIVSRELIIAKIDEISLLVKERSERLIIIEQQLIDCSAEKEVLKQELVIMAAEVKLLEEKRVTLTNELNNALTRIRELEKQLTTALSTIDALHLVIQKLQKENAALNAKVALLEKENKDLLKQIEDLTNTSNPDEAPDVDYTFANDVRTYIRNGNMNYKWLGRSDSINKGPEFNQLGNTDIFYLILDGNIIIIRWGASPRNDAGMLEGIFGFTVYDGGYLSVNGSTPVKMRIVKENQVDALNIDEILIRMSKSF